MSIPKKQHYIPKTYLRQFAENGNSSFVWVLNLKNKYKKHPERLGVNHKVFKLTDYYTSKSFEDPYWLEKTFSKKIENYYPRIIDELKKEDQISESIREDILLWVFSSQLRSPIFRDNFNRIGNWTLKMKSILQKDNVYNDHQKEIEEYLNKMAKQSHINSFGRKEVVEIFARELINKRWTIFKPPAGFKFWTNDNPGFSPNLNPQFQEETPFHHHFELNQNSVCYFVLSSDYCIQFTPFLEDDPIEMNGYNMTIEFHVADEFILNQIMKGTFHTAYKLVIADNKSILETLISKKNSD